jgi:integrase
VRTIKPYVTNKGVTTYPVRFITDTGRQSRYTFDNREHAEQFVALLPIIGPTAALAQLGTPDEERAPTLDRVAAEHIDKWVDGTAGTKLKYHRDWARTWGPLLGGYPANTVTREAVQAAMRELIPRYAYKSLKNHRGLLSGVCGLAVTQKYLPRNPVYKIKLPRGDEAAVKEMVILEPADFEQLSAVFHNHYRPLARFLYGTGCRWGEAVVLTVADVNLSKPEVYFRRGLEWSPDNVRPIGNTKSRKGKRRVVVNDELAVTLAELIRDKAPWERVFNAPRGGMVQHRTFTSDIWYPALMRAGMTDPRPRIHDLRHSHITNLLSRGVLPEVVQERVGHESILTTMGYRHVMPHERDAAAHAASLAFG